MTNAQHEQLNQTLGYDLLDLFMGLRFGKYSQSQVMELVNSRVELAFDLGKGTASSHS